MNIKTISLLIQNNPNKSGMITSTNFQLNGDSIGFTLENNSSLSLQETDNSNLNIDSFYIDDKIYLLNDDLLSFLLEDLYSLSNSFIEYRKTKILKTYKKLSKFIHSEYDLCAWNIVEYISLSKFKLINQFKKYKLKKYISKNIDEYRNNEYITNNFPFLSSDNLDFISKFQIVRTSERSPSDMILLNHTNCFFTTIFTLLLFFKHKYQLNFAIRKDNIFDNFNLILKEKITDEEEKMIFQTCSLSIGNTYHFKNFSENHAAILLMEDFLKLINNNNQSVSFIYKNNFYYNIHMNNYEHFLPLFLTVLPLYVLNNPYFKDVVNHEKVSLLFQEFNDNKYNVKYAYNPCQYYTKCLTIPTDLFNNKNDMVESINFISTIIANNLQKINHTYWKLLSEDDLGFTTLDSCPIEVNNYLVGLIELLNELINTESIKDERTTLLFETIGNIKQSTNTIRKKI